MTSSYPVGSRHPEARKPAPILSGDLQRYYLCLILSFADPHETLLPIAIRIRVTATPIYVIGTLGKVK
jgi:hypothetical protein